MTIELSRSYGLTSNVLRDFRVATRFEEEDPIVFPDGRVHLPSIREANFSIEFACETGTTPRDIVGEAARLLRKFYGLDGEDLVASKVILSGPATVMIWQDGSKTVAKCRKGDECDYVFGMMACILRKLTRNRGHAVDDNEDALRAMAESIESMGDLDELIDYTRLMLNTLTVLRGSSDAWEGQLGDPDDATAGGGGDCPEDDGQSESENDAPEMARRLHEYIDAISESSADGLAAVSKLLLGGGRDE